MSIFLSIIAFFLIFSLLVLIHEGGHFWMAKRAGVKVEEFGFGLPPKIFGKKYGETTYSLNWIPFGGFVRLFGEDITNKKVLVSQRSFVNKSIRDRILIVCGGVIMNFILAFILLILGFVIGMQPLFVSDEDILTAISNGDIEIQEGVLEDKPVIYLSNFVVESVAENNVFGIQNNDVIWKIDGENIWSVSDLYTKLIDGMPRNILVKREQQELSLNAPFGIKVGIQEVVADSFAESFGFLVGEKIIQMNNENIYHVEDLIQFNIDNAGKEVSYMIEDADGTLKATSFSVPDNGKLGLLLEPVYNFSLYNFNIKQEMAEYSILNIHDVKLPFHLAFMESFKEVKRLSKATFKGVSSFFISVISKGDVPDSVAGPVGIAQLVHVSVEEGFSSLIRLTALLSLSLAVLNILPIPALDGGKLLFIAIEVIRGKKSNAKLEALVHQIGYMLLLFLIILVTYKDVVRLITSKEP